MIRIEKVIKKKEIFSFLLILVLLSSCGGGGGSSTEGSGGLKTNSPPSFSIMVSEWSIPENQTEVLHEEKILLTTYYIDYLIEDMDMFAYGCKRIMKNLNKLND